MAVRAIWVSLAAFLFMLAGSVSVAEIGAADRTEAQDGFGASSWPWETMPAQPQSADGLDNGRNLPRLPPPAPEASTRGFGCVSHPPIKITEEEGLEGFILARTPGTGSAVYRPGSGVTGGAGTPDDPYVIQGWCVDAVPEGFASRAVGVQISGTQSHVVIKDNVIEGFTQWGVMAEGAGNVSVDSNTIRNNHGGISLTETDGASIKGNRVRNYGVNQVYLQGTRGTLVHGNNVSWQPPPPPGPTDSGRDGADGGFPAGVRGFDNEELKVSGNHIHEWLLVYGLDLKETWGLRVALNLIETGPGVAILLEGGMDQQIIENHVRDTFQAVAVLQGADRVTIEGNLIEDAVEPSLPAITVSGGRTEVKANVIRSFWLAIRLEGVSRGAVEGNWISDAAGGLGPMIDIVRCEGMTITDNRLDAEGGTVEFLFSSDAIARRNELSGGAFVLRGDGLEDYLHSIDETNMIDGRPVRYLRGLEDAVIDVGDAAQVVLVDSRRVTLRDATFGSAVPVQVLASQEVTLQNLTMRGAATAVSSADVAGLRLRESAIEAASLGVHLLRSADAEITGTRFHDGGDGIVVEESAAARIVNNQIQDMNGSGVSFRASGDSMVEHNDLVANQEGVLLVDSWGVTIRHNELADNGYGVFVANGSSGDGGGHVLRHNNLHGNSGAGVRVETGLAADARENWWGCSEGPGAAGCDAAEGAVDYSDWLPSPVPDAGAWT